MLGLVALIVSLSSSASATSSNTLVRKGDIAPGAVTAKALAKGPSTPRRWPRGPLR
ncbi:MAG TPA: hypothetical protein VFJ64_02225 [Solirubrobacterales bacterium]|nr:hypothetical protein [Solirubrobacterales bacterium]